MRLSLSSVVLSIAVCLLGTSCKHENKSEAGGSAASAALGATPFQTVIHVVIPQAAPGILTGTILAVSRGAGEVAPILFTGAAYFLPSLPHAIHDQFMEIGYHIYVLCTQSPDVDATKPLLYATVVVLLGLTFLLNAAAIVVRARMRRRFSMGRP